MQGLLLPLLAALALPTTVNAEVANYYLLFSWAGRSWTVPMETEELYEAPLNLLKGEFQIRKYAIA